MLLLAGLSVVVVCVGRLSNLLTVAGTISRTNKHVYAFLSVKAQCV